MTEWTLLMPSLALTFVAVVSVAYVRSRRRRAAFIAAFADDPEYQAFDLAIFTGVTVKTRRARLFVEAVATSESSGRSRVDLWQIEVRGIRLGMKTTLTLEREGIISGLTSMMGFKDIETGDKYFDDTWNIGGSDADMVRAALAPAAVKTAIMMLFNACSVRQFMLGRDGDLKVEIYRAGLQPDEVRKALDLVRRLAELLDEQHNSTPVLEPIKGTIASLGAGSGVPVAVR